MVTPYQMMFGKVPNLANLFIFGSRAEAFVDEALRKKGEHRSRSGIFVGYDESTKAYKFLPDGERKWISIRSIVCNERDMVPDRRMDDVEAIEVQKIKRPSVLEANDHADEQKVGERELCRSAKGERRVTRLQLRNKILENSVALVAVDDLGGEYHLPGAGINLAVPKSISAAFSCPEQEQWKKAVEEEMDAIQEAGTLSEPVQAPMGTRITGLKFIFTKKVGEDGKVNRFKARLVYNHSSKEESEENNYSSVANRISLRLFLAAVMECQWHMV
jgi:hypothetical protein